MSKEAPSELIMPADELKSLLIRSKREPVSAAIALTNEGEGLILLDRKARPGKLAGTLRTAAAKAKLSVNVSTVRFGRAEVDIDQDAGLVCFYLSKEAPASMRAKLVEVVKRSGMQRVSLAVEEGLDDDGEGTAPTAAALAESTAEAAAEAAPVVPADDQGKAFNQHLARLVPRFKQAVADRHPAAETVKAKLAEAGELARQQAFGDALRMLDDAQRLLDAPASAGDTTAAAATDHAAAEQAFKARLVTLMPIIREAAASDPALAATAKQQTLDATARLKAQDVTGANAVLDALQASLAAALAGPAAGGVAGVATAAAGPSGEAATAADVAAGFRARMADLVGQLKSLATSQPAVVTAVKPLLTEATTAFAAGNVPGALDLLDQATARLNAPAPDASGTDTPAADGEDPVMAACRQRLDALAPAMLNVSSTPYPLVAADFGDDDEEGNAAPAKPGAYAAALAPLMQDWNQALAAFRKGRYAEAAQLLDELSSGGRIQQLLDLRAAAPNLIRMPEDPAARAALHRNFLATRWKDLAADLDALTAGLLQDIIAGDGDDEPEQLAALVDEHLQAIRKDLADQIEDVLAEGDAARLAAFKRRVESDEVLRFLNAADFVDGSPFLTAFHSAIEELQAALAA